MIKPVKRVGVGLRVHLLMDNLAVGFWKNVELSYASALWEISRWRRIVETMQYIAIKVPYRRVNESTSTIIRLDRWTTTNWYPSSSCAHQQIIWIIPLYSRASFMAKQLHIHQKWHLHRYFRFWPMDHSPLVASPVITCKLLSVNVQLREPKVIGFNCALCLDKSNRHAPIVVTVFDALKDSSSSVSMEYTYWIIFGATSRTHTVHGVGAR